MKIKNKIVSLMVLLMLAIGNIGIVSATQKINISGVPTTVKPGQSFNITVSISGCLGGTVNISGENCSITPSVIMIDGSDTFRVVAGSEGNAKIIASSSYATLNDGSFGTTDAYGSKTFKIASKSNTSKPSQSRPSQEPQEDPRSKNNNLKSLTINQGTLDPKFSANTTKYSVSLAADVTELSIEAKADDGKAKVSGTGKHTLKAGKNEIKVVCTSEYGTKKEYVIVAMVDEKPLVYLDYNGSQLGVVRNFDDVKAPDGFKETTVKVEDKETKAWVNKEINKTIIYLMNDANEKNFYVYEDGKVLTVLKPVTLSGLKLFIIDIEQSLQKRESMKYTEVEVDGQKLNGWIFSEKSFENYVLIYAMDSKGEMKYYQYEKTSQTLQPYSHAAPVTAEAYEKALNDANVQKYIFMGISGILAVIMVGGVIYYLKKVKKD